VISGNWGCLGNKEYLQLQQGSRDTSSIAGKPLVIRPEPSDKAWPPEALLIKR
jgi:hypothetical protein